MTTAATEVQMKPNGKGKGTAAQAKAALAEGPKKATPRSKPETKDKAVTQQTTEAAREGALMVGKPAEERIVELVPREMIVCDQSNNKRDPIDLKNPDEEFVELAISIREEGYNNPSWATKRKDGKYEIMAGFRRFMASSAFEGRDREGRHWKFDAMPLVKLTVFEPLTDVDRVIQRGVENGVRKSLTQWEKSLEVLELKELTKARGDNGGEGMSAVEIGRAMKMDRTTVTNMLGWQTKLIAPLKKCLENNQITSVDANKLYSRTKEEQKEWHAAWKRAKEEAGQDPDEKKKGRGGVGQKEGKKMPRRDVIVDEMYALDKREEIRIGGEWIDIDKAKPRQAMYEMLRWITGELKTCPIRGGDEEEEEDGEAE